jgi:hypothetical protein
MVQKFIQVFIVNILHTFTLMSEISLGHFRLILVETLIFEILDLMFAKDLDILVGSVTQ